jgi:3-hydroxyacyl-[acyl-carrier-protein] dehydratase
LSGSALGQVDADQFFEGGATRRLTVPDTLWVFETHFPRMAVLPGALILGGLSEGGTWRVAGLQDVRIRRYVRPGDRLELTVVRESSSSGVAVLRGTATVDAVIVVSSRQIILRSGAVT